MSESPDLPDPEHVYRDLRDYPHMLDVEMAAEILCVSKGTVRTMEERGSITSVRVGRQIRIPTERLLRDFKLLPDDPEPEDSDDPRE